MTKRRSLTPKERAQMAADQGYRCGCGCDNPLTEKTIAEHWITVALGNESKPDCLLNYECAQAKTKRDVKAIAKVKRIIRKREGTWRPNKKRIANRGFDKGLRKKFSGEIIKR